MAVRKVTLADGSVRWRLRLYLGRDGSGKQHIATRTFDRKKDADAEEARLRVCGGRLPGYNGECRTPLGEYLATWLEDVKAPTVRTRTLHGYRQSLRCHLTNSPNPIRMVPLNRVAHESIQALYQHLGVSQGLASSTIRNLHAVIKQGLDYAVKVGDIKENPSRFVELPKLMRQSASAMTTEEARRFLTAVDQEESGPWRALFYTLLLTGIGPSEAFALRWADLDLIHGTLHVRFSLSRQGVDKQKYPGGWALTEPKTKNRRRSVEMSAALVGVLAEWKEGRGRLGLAGGDAFVFASREGAPLDLGNTTRVFQRAMERAGFGEYVTVTVGDKAKESRRRFKPFCRLYDLRHTHATALFAQGVHPKVVQERLGHGSVSTTLDVYTAHVPAMQHGAVRVLDALFSHRKISHV